MRTSTATISRRSINVTMTPLKGPDPAGTDVWMACNAYTYEAKTGVLNRFTLKKFFPDSAARILRGDGAGCAAARSDRRRRDLEQPR